MTLLLPIVAYLVVINDSFIYSFVYLFARVFLLIFVFLLLNSVFCFRTTAYIMCFTIFLTVPIEFIHIIFFNSYITQAGLKSMLNTNVNEGIGFLRGYEWLAILFLGLFIFYILSFWKLPKREKFKLLNRKNLIFLSLTNFSSIFFFFIQVKITKNDYESGKKLTGTPVVFSTKYFIRMDITKMYPFNILYRSYEIFVNNNSLKSYKKNVEKFTFNGYQTSYFEEEQIYVLIIGESARASNYQIFGYNRENNPILMNMNNLIIFPDFYSTANLTTYAVPLIITRATAQNFDITFKEKSIITLFKEAGFQTYWICNQEIFEGLGAKKYKYEIENFYYTQGYDESVIPIIDEIIKNKENKKKFIVVNLLGNHYGVSVVPEKFHLYVPNIDVKKLVNRIAKNRELFINSYDNSVLYQDYVLSEIINLINSSNSISYVYFSSDHGESLFDEPDFFYGHGASKITKEQIHIPVFLWYSPLFEKYNGEIIRNTQINKNKKLSHDFTFYTLAQLASINFDKFDANMSFADSTFISPEIRYVLKDENSYEPVEFN